MRSFGASMSSDSITGPPRTSELTAASACTRATVSCGASVATRPAIATSRSVSSRLHGLNSTAPSVTVRPSASPARRSTCDFSNGGTASQANAYNASTPATTKPKRRNHFIGARRAMARRASNRHWHLSS